MFADFLFWLSIINREADINASPAIYENMVVLNKRDHQKSIILSAPIAPHKHTCNTVVYNLLPYNSQKWNNRILGFLGYTQISPEEDHSFRTIISQKSSLPLPKFIITHGHLPSTKPCTYTVDGASYSIEGHYIFLTFGWMPYQNESIFWWLNGK